METLAERAIAHIRKVGTTRSNVLAIRLDSDQAAVDAALAPHCESGELVRCGVTLIGKGEVNEYRLSAAGPRKGDDSHLRKPPIPPEQVLAEAKAKAARAPTQTKTEGDSMASLKDKILAAYAKHGPMTTRQLAAHVADASRSMICAQLTGAKELIKLGGGPCSTIYGLPGQKLPKGNSDKAAPAAPNPAKKRSAPKRKVQRNTATSTKRPRPASKPAKLRKKNADLRMPYADATPSAFRTEIASDGAMIFLGAAAGPFELTRPESRALIAFVRTLDRGEVAA